MLQTPLVHLVVKHTHDRGQLIKVGTLTQSFGLLLWALWTLSHISGFGMKAQFHKAFFPRWWKCYTEFQGVPSSLTNIEFLVMLAHLAMLSELRTAELAGETCLPPPCLGLLSILPKC